MIPQYSIILPVRCRTTFTTNALPTLIKNGVRKDHQIILILDRTSLTYEMQRYPNKFLPDALKQDEEGIKRVDSWIETHPDILKKYNIDIVIAKGGEDLWLDHRRISFVLEQARKHIKHDWVLAYADEDLVFHNNWDANIWRYMLDKDPMKFCVVPSMVVPSFMNPKPDISFTWLNDYINFVRNGSWSVLPLPFSEEILDATYRVPYKIFDDYVEKVLIYGNAWFELCGVRDKSGSFPFFLYKPLLDSINGWAFEGLYSEHHSLDARFDYRLGHNGVTKIIPRDCLVLHTKRHLFISDDIDKSFGSITESPISGSVTQGIL